MADEDSAPLLWTARNPGYTPPHDYVKYLDVGGELADLESTKNEKILKKGIQTCLKRPIEELFALIDSTGQADTAKRDAIDDMS